MYEHTDIPAGLTLSDYRRARPRLATDDDLQTWQRDDVVVLKIHGIRQLEWMRLWAD